MPGRLFFAASYSFQSCLLLPFTEIYSFNGTSDLFDPTQFTVTVGANSITAG